VLVRGFGRGAVWTHRLLACLAAPPIVGFALISAWSSQRILFHWAAPGYLMLFPLIGGAIGRARMQRVMMGSAAVIVVALTVIACQIQFDWLGGSLARIMRTDPTAEGVDWVSVRDGLRARGLLVPGAVVAALNWRDAGKLGYALGPDVTMLCLCLDSRQFGFADAVRDYAGQDALVLVVSPAGSGEASNWFSQIQVLPPASVRLDGRVLRTITVLRGVGLRPAH
jgi:hypothetical protein